MVIAGGGIVFDSVEEEEYVETINKLGANVKCIEDAERQSLVRLELSRADPPSVGHYARLQGQTT